MGVSRTSTFDMTTLATSNAYSSRFLTPVLAVAIALALIAAHRERNVRSDIESRTINVLSYKGSYRVVEKRTGVVYLVDLGDQKCTFHVNLLRKYKRSTYASPSPCDNLDKVDNACSNQAFAGATSLCDPSVFPFGSLGSVQSSLNVDTVVDKELDPNRDSDLRFCETICFAEPSTYVSAISDEDGGEIGSLVTTPLLASESGTVVIDPSLSSSQVQNVMELLIEFQDILTSIPGCKSTLCHEIRLTTDAVIRVKPYPLGAVQI
ncbi:hypothetical protein PoB_004152900 [Plakobranchus ocellatus]|uniref:Uncharacterized protein n=1 Tax=Plakobranchus ocellatus TaxID=259542 RepID=A0AAV4B8K3_9GAST|nr:hypothetical protein PoB_004152900 [Plakobranchus ocellatus]